MIKTIEDSTGYGLWRRQTWSKCPLP